MSDTVSGKRIGLTEVGERESELVRERELAQKKGI